MLIAALHELMAAKVAKSAVSEPIQPLIIDDDLRHHYGQGSQNVRLGAGLDHEWCIQVDGFRPAAERCERNGEKRCQGANVHGASSMVIADFTLAFCEWMWCASRASLALRSKKYRSRRRHSSPKNLNCTEPLAALRAAVLRNPEADRNGSRF